MKRMYYAVDSDIRPIWNYPVEKGKCPYGEPFEYMPTDQYELVWASRFGKDACWHVFPKA